MKAGKSKADAPKKADNKRRGPTRQPASRRSVRRPERIPTNPRGPQRLLHFHSELKGGVQGAVQEEEKPNIKQVLVIGKASGEKWKSLSDVDKASYVAKANKLKVDYDKKMVSYNKKESRSGNKKTAEDEESDKSKSKVHDDEEDGSEE